MDGEEEVIGYGHRTPSRSQGDSAHRGRLGAVRGCGHGYGSPKAEG